MLASIPTERTTMIEFTVKDMTCGHCASTITKAVKEVDANGKVEIDLAAHRVRIESALEASEFKDAIEEAGYTPVPA
jgi:copper chaperone